MSKSNVGGSSKKVANGLVAVGFAGVLAVYSAGYARTREAANRFENQSNERRSSAPETAQSGEVRSARTNQVVEASRSSEVAVTTTVEPRSASATPNQIAEVNAAITPRPADAPTSIEPLPSTPAATPTAVTQPLPAAIEQPAVPAPAKAPTALVEQAVVQEKPPAPRWRDGTYTGWGTSRHGDIQAEVIIERGRIASATIAQCLTRYSCDVIDMLPPQVTLRQSSDVDSVSRATQSADAFYFAVTEALNKAK